ncbi:unnamed protein product [Gongylonema pulchrum]|uniref:Uncharacterized protein n=1 Tax=Gongylonema pulchrum TaxID=637853 RepID=A0A3P7M0L6_9BILA|nr:unnamed protein product [Gongylonema pulchrum]
MKACEDEIPPECHNQIVEIRTAICGCIEDTRVYLKKQLAKIAGAIRNVVEANDRGAASIGGGSKVESCVAVIKSLVFALLPFGHISAKISMRFVWRRMDVPF